MPGRVKAMHFYNHGPIVEGVYEVLKNFLTKKVKDRVSLKIHISAQMCLRHIWVFNILFTGWLQKIGQLIC